MRESKDLWDTIEISDKATRSSTNNESAFVNLLNDEMDGLIKSSSFNSDVFLINSTYEDYYTRYSNYNLAVELTSEKLQIKNLDVLMHLKYESLISLLIHDSILPDIDKETFFRNNYLSKWLDHTGSIED